MVRPVRFELTTYSFGGCRSIHLSYGRICTAQVHEKTLTHAKSAACLIILTLAQPPRHRAFATGQPHAQFADCVWPAKIRGRPDRVSSALRTSLNLAGKLLNFLSFLDHRQRQNLRGVRLLDFSLQVCRQLKQFLDVFLDVLLVGFEQRLAG